MMAYYNTNNVQKLLCLLAIWCFLTCNTEAQVGTTVRTPNLVYQPNCDGGTINPSYWSNGAGTWSCVTTGTIHPCCYGDLEFGFFADQVANAQLKQTVNLAQYSGIIDSGLATFNIQAYHRSYEQTPSDQGKIDVTFFNANNQQVDIYTSPVGAPLSWVTISNNRNALVGVRYAVFSLWCIRKTGLECNSYFDGASLQVSYPDFACPIGKYGYNNCTSCPIGFTTPKIGAPTIANCSLCAIGYRRGFNNTCIPLDCRHGYLASDSCIMCDSGYQGNECEISPKNTCNSLSLTKNVVAENSTPKLDQNSTLFVNNSLRVSVLTPYVSNRKYTVLGWDQATWALCSGFNATSLWKKSVLENCTDNYVFTLPWSNNSLCGFTQQPTGETGVKTVGGKLLIAYQDLIGNLTGSPLYRAFSTSFDIFVKFPTALEVSMSNLVISNTGNVMDVGVTAEKYDDVAKILTIQLTVVQNWPNMLLPNFSVSLPPTTQLADTNLYVINTQCTSSHKSACKQDLQIKLRLTDPATCSFSGDYDVSTRTKSCRESGDLCDTKDLSFSFYLSTQSVCASVSLEKKIAGSLMTYDKIDFLAPKFVYAMGERVYFLLSLDNNDNSRITIQFLQITFDSGTGARDLFTNKTTLDLGVRSGLEVNSAQRYFTIVPSASVLTATPTEHVMTWTLSAKCKVTYEGNSENDKKKKRSDLLDLQYNDVVEFSAHSSIHVMTSSRKKPTTHNKFEPANNRHTTTNNKDNNVNRYKQYPHATDQLLWIALAIAGVGCAVGLLAIVTISVTKNFVQHR